MSSVIRHADATVRSMLEPYAQRRLTHRHRRATTVVEGLLAARPDVIPRLVEVARALNISARTLQLRLAADGTSFSALTDAVQHERALALLAQPDLPVTTIATRTGFANPAAFTRAFRRWTGTTPSLYRNDQGPRRTD